MNRTALVDTSIDRKSCYLEETTSCLRERSRLTPSAGAAPFFSRHSAMKCPYHHEVASVWAISATAPDRLPFFFFFFSFFKKLTHHVCCRQVESQLPASCGMTVIYLSLKSCKAIIGLESICVVALRPILSDTSS